MNDNCNIKPDKSIKHTALMLYILLMNRNGKNSLILRWIINKSCRSSQMIIGKLIYE